MRVILGGEDVSRTSAMTQQLANGHTGSKVPVGVVGPVGCDRLIERELSLSYELKNRDRGEHLVHGTQAELGVSGITYLPLAFSHTPGLVENNLAVMRDEDRSRERIRFTRLCDMLLHSLCQVLIARSGMTRA